VSDWTQADLDAVNQAIAQGVTRVRFGEKTVEYRSLRELHAIRRLIRNDLGLDQPVRRKYGVFKHGFE